MASIVIYSTPICPYCVRAKELFTRKGQRWTEIDVSDDVQRAAMIEKTGGRRTVPQIFIDDRHIGGYDDLAALDRAGELDSLLG